MVNVVVGYLLLTVVGPVAGFFAGKYTSPAIGASVAGGISTIAGIMLHKSDWPVSLPPAAPDAPKSA